MRSSSGPFWPLGVLRNLRTRFLYRAYDAVYTARTRPEKGTRDSFQEILGPGSHSFDRVGALTRYVWSKAPGVMEHIHQLLHCPHRMPLLASATGPFAFGREASCIVLHGTPKVLKVHRGSLGQDVPNLVRIAKRLEAEYETLLRWYAPVPALLPHTMHLVMCVPLRGVRGVVRIQDLVPEPSRDLLMDFSDDDLVELMGQNPRLSRDFSAFVGATMNAWDRERQFLDLVGANNLVLVHHATEPEMRVVDLGVVDLARRRRTAPHYVRRASEVLARLERVALRVGCVG